MKYQKAIENLIEGIKADYKKWSTWPEGIERFNAGVHVKSGKKYDKVIQGSSVWGWKYCRKNIAQTKMYSKLYCG